MLLISRIRNLHLNLMLLPNNSLEFNLLDLIILRRETLSEECDIDWLGVSNVALDAFKLDFFVFTFRNNGWVEGYVKGELFMGRNITTLRSDVEYVATEIEIPMEFSRHITNVADNEFLSEL